VINLNYMYLNKFFSKKKITDELFTDFFNAKVFNDELKKNYHLLKKGYRNEFFFKNTLFNKLVLGKYSLTTTAAFSEVVVKKSKADFVLINRNKGIVYEIKTDLDNLDRLVYQLEDYSNAFSLVYVVTSEKNYYPVYKVVKESNPSVGIIVLTENVNLSVRRKAIENDSKLNHEVLFKLLRKKEYEQILLMKYGSLPNVTPVLYFKTSFQWFKAIKIKEAQSLVFNILRQRNDIYFEKILKGLPMEIRWLIYTSNFKSADLLRIYDKLNLS
jgi:hypothetical protein